MRIWKKASLESLCTDTTSGGTPSTHNTSYYGGEIPWLRTQEVTFNRIKETAIKITEDGLNNSSAKWIPENSVIVAMYGNSAGRTAINKIPLTTNQACCNLLIDKTKADYRYVFYRLWMDYEVLHSLARGAAQNNLNATQVKEYEIPKPDLNVQERIGNILSSYDDLIENNSRRIQLLEESARQLYKEWFVRGRFPGYEHTQITKGIPEGWRKIRLDEIAEIVMGQSPESRFYNSEGEGLPFHQGVTGYGERFVSHEIYSTAINRVAEPEDILCSVRAPVGRLNITMDKIVIGRGLSAIRSKAGYQSMLYYQLRNHFFKEDMIGSGAIYASVTKEQLASQELLTPTEILIQQFEANSVEVDKQIKNLFLQNMKLKQARDLLLPKLMSGEIAV